jgi:hypothetical protein
VFEGLQDFRTSAVGFFNFLGSLLEEKYTVNIKILLTSMKTLPNPNFYRKQQQNSILVCLSVIGRFPLVSPPIGWRKNPRRFTGQSG